VVDRFPVMMESAGLMLRAGGAVGLPRLLNSGIVNEDELGESDEGESAAAAPNGFDMSTLVAQVIPLVITALSNGNFKLPSVASLLDWRKAAPTHPNQAPISEAAARSSEPKSAQVPESTIPVMDPAMMAHFLTIQSALQPSEAAMARAVAADLQPVELRAWFDDLSKLSVPEAVSKIRAMIASGGAS